jgi:hypothetical protein
MYQAFVAKRAHTLFGRLRVIVKLEIDRNLTNRYRDTERADAGERRRLMLATTTVEDVTSDCVTSHACAVKCQVSSKHRQA